MRDGIFDSPFVRDSEERSADFVRVVARARWTTETLEINRATAYYFGIFQTDNKDGGRENSRALCMIEKIYHPVAQEPRPTLEHSWLAQYDGNVGRPSGLKVGFADSHWRRSDDIGDRVNSRDLRCNDLLCGQAKIDGSWFVASLHPLDSLFAVNIPFIRQHWPRYFFFGREMDCIRRRPWLADWRAAV